MNKRLVMLKKAAKTAKSVLFLPWTLFSLAIIRLIAWKAGIKDEFPCDQLDRKAK